MPCIGGVLVVLMIGREEIGFGRANKDGFETKTALLVNERTRNKVEMNSNTLNNSIREHQYVDGSR